MQPSILLLSLAASAFGGGELVYDVERDFSLEESPTPVLRAGQLTVTTRASASEAVDLDRLIDSDGTSYIEEADVIVEREGGTAISRVSVRQAEAIRLTDAERDELFLATHPDQSLSSFHDRRARTPDLVDTPVAVDPLLMEWSSKAASVELIDVVVQLRNRPPLALPARSFDPLARGPSFDAAATERASAREQWEAEARVALDAFEAEATKAGAVPRRRLPALYLTELSATPAALDALAEHPEVATIHAIHEATPDANAGSEIQHATQVFMALDNGYDGGQPSGMVTGATAMSAVIVDTQFDQDHPVWSDRLIDWYHWDENLGGFQFGQFLDVSQTTSGGAHGSSVTTQLLANGAEHLGEPLLTSADRSGTSTESSFVFLGCKDGDESCNPFTHGVDWMTDEGFLPDLFQASYSMGSLTWCAQGTSNGTYYPEVAAMNWLYHQGVFISTTPGNTGAASGCSVRVPATAAGGFPAGNIDHDAPVLKTAKMDSGSPIGGDAHGRAMIRLVAPGGREEWMADYDDAYTSATAPGTSYAQPVLAGAALDLKDMYVSLFGSGVANHVGNLYSGLLLMGDDIKQWAIVSGVPIQFPQTRDHDNPEVDRWAGMGRVAFRTYGAAGMDAPHRTRVHRSVLADGDQTIIPANPQQGINTALPADVERLEAVVWWFEPNLACLPPDYLGCQPPADLTVQLCSGTTCYDSNSTAPGPRRLIAPSPAGGSAWEVRVSGLSIPDSEDPDYLFGQDKREIHVTILWEDRDRDDADGPTCADEIDMLCATCCAQSGASCGPTECDP